MIQSSESQQRSPQHLKYEMINEWWKQQRFTCADLHSCCWTPLRYLLFLDDLISLCWFRWRQMFRGLMCWCLVKLLTSLSRWDEMTCVVLYKVEITQLNTALKATYWIYHLTNRFVKTWTFVICLFLRMCLIWQGGKKTALKVMTRGFLLSLSI